MKDLLRDLSPVLSMYLQTQTAAAEGDAVVDLQGYEGALIICMSGAVTTDCVFQLMECATSGGTYTAVADADLVGTEPTLLAATDDEIATFAYIGSKRYLRVDITAGAGVVGAAVLRGFPRHAPSVT